MMYGTIQDTRDNDNDSHWCDKVLALGTSGHKLLLVALVAVKAVLPEKDKKNWWRWRLNGDNSYIEVLVPLDEVGYGVDLNIYCV